MGTGNNTQYTNIPRANDEVIKSEIKILSNEIIEYNKLLEKALYGEEYSEKNAVKEENLQQLVEKNQELSFEKKYGNKVLITDDEKIEKIDNYLLKNKEMSSSLFEQKNFVINNAEGFEQEVNSREILGILQLGNNGILFEQQIRHTADIIDKYCNQKAISLGTKNYILTGTHVNNGFEEDTLAEDKTDRLVIEKLNEQKVINWGSNADYKTRVSKFFGRANTIDTIKDFFDRNSGILQELKNESSDKIIVIVGALDVFVERIRYDLELFMKKNPKYEFNLNKVIFTAPSIKKTEEYLEEEIKSLKNELLELKATEIRLEEMSKSPSSWFCCCKSKSKDYIENKNKISEAERRLKTATRFSKYKKTIHIDNKAREFYTRKKIIEDNSKKHGIVMNY